MTWDLEVKKRKFHQILDNLSNSSSNSNSNVAGGGIYRSIPRATTAETELSIIRAQPESLAAAAAAVSASKKRKLRPIPSSEELCRAYLPACRRAFLERLGTFRGVTRWRVGSSCGSGSCGNESGGWDEKGVEWSGSARERQSRNEEENESMNGVNAVAWAGRGWCCVDVDTVWCGSCSERVVVDLSTDGVGRRKTGVGVEDDKKNSAQHQSRGETVQTDRKDEQAEDDEDEAEDQSQNQGQDEVEAEQLQEAVYQALVQKYKQMIVTAHAAHCPWRKRGCDRSIQRIEGLLNISYAFERVRERYTAMRENASDVPVVAALPLDDYGVVSADLADIGAAVSLAAAAAADRPANDNADAAANATMSDPNILRLALCGWTNKPHHPDVLECKHCFRSLGLWLYRGPTPTVERLDPVDSHLEYCPWRSAAAQDTEIVLRSTEVAQKRGSTSIHDRDTRANATADANVNVRVRVPGWVVNYLGVTRYIHRQQKTSSITTATTSMTTTTTMDENDGNHDGEREDQGGVEQNESPEQVDRKVRDLIGRIREARKPFNVRALLNRRKRGDTSR